MKKPDIKLKDEWTFHMSIIKDGNSMFPDEIKDAYEEMIDALLVAKEQLIEEYELNGTSGRRIKIYTEYIDKALKKAGCTDD